MTPTDLFHTHTRLAYQIARKYVLKNRRLDPDDADQVALGALWLAATRFDPESGNKFSTFATHYIAGIVLSHIRDKLDLVRRPAKDFWSLPLQVTAELPKEIGVDTQTPLALLLEAEESRERAEDVDDLLGQLTLPEAVVFELIAGHEIERSEVASRLGISKAKLKALWTSARKKLGIGKVPAERKPRKQPPRKTEKRWGVRKPLPEPKTASRKGVRNKQPPRLR